MEYFKLVVVNHMIFYRCTKFEVVCLSCSGGIQETLQHHKTFERFCPSLYSGFGWFWITPVPQLIVIYHQDMLQILVNIF